MKNKKRLLLMAIAILLIPALVYCFLHIFLGEDTKISDDSDLMLERLDILDKENAYFVLQELNKSNLNVVSTKEYEEILSSKKLDLEKIEKIINNNQEYFIVANGFLEKKYFQDPLYSSSENISMNSEIISLNNLRQVDRLLSLKSLYDLSQNDISRSIDYAFQEISIG